MQINTNRVDIVNFVFYADSVNQDCMIRKYFCSIPLFEQYYIVASWVVEDLANLQIQYVIMLLSLKLCT